MEYEINIIEDAWQDLQYFKAYEQGIIVDAIERYLRGAFQFWGNLSEQRPVRFGKPDRSAPNLKYTLI